MVCSKSVVNVTMLQNMFLFVHSTAMSAPVLCYKISQIKPNFYLQHVHWKLLRTGWANYLEPVRLCVCMKIDAASFPKIRYHGSHLDGKRLIATFKKANIF